MGWYDGTSGVGISRSRASERAFYWVDVLKWADLQFFCIGSRGAKSLNLSDLEGQG